MSLGEPAPSVEPFIALNRSLCSCSATRKTFQAATICMALMVASSRCSAAVASDGCERNRGWARRPDDFAGLRRGCAEIVESRFLIFD